MTDSLVSAYTKYRIEKAKIKIQQRAELELRLQPFAEAVGKAIEEARYEGGLRIEDVLVTIGTKNRKTAYDFINAYRASKVPALPTVEETEELEYEIRYDYVNAIAQVTVGGTTHIVKLDKDGLVLSLPDRWVEDVDKRNRDLYRKIAREINANT